VMCGGGILLKPSAGMWIERSCLEFRPALATACGFLTARPIDDSLFVVAKLVKHSCMFDKNHLEGWVVAWNLVRQHLEVPFPKEVKSASVDLEGSE